MPGHPPAVVQPPSPTGGRLVRVDAEILGVAYGVGDVEEFLRRAGLDTDMIDVATTELIDWRGGGPDVW